jgi:hypothetical protein
MEDAVAEYLTHVQTDGTDEGYLQLALLQLLGGQFYLYWHANYNDAQIICNEAELEDLLATSPWYDQDKTLADLLTSTQLRQMRAADVAPQVEIGDDTVKVRMTFFTHWGGLIEGVWTISRSFPHQVELNTQTLVEYESGIMF